MAITVGWDNDEHTIIRETVEGEWTWAEIDVAEKQVRSFLEAAPGKTHVMVVVQNTRLPNNTLGHLRKLSDSFGPRHPNVGLIIIVAALSMVKTVMDIGARVFAPIGEIKIVKTVEEAYELIEAHSRAA